MTDASQGPTPLRVEDIDAAERAMRASDGSDFAEAKEAIVDALLALTYRQCSGEGEEGAIVYAQKPSSAFVSGFLLPRFDASGADDTSDIHIAAMGLDLQVAAAAEDAVSVQPKMAFYVRVLPTWEEISDPRLDLMPRIALSRAVYQQVETIARSIIDAQIARMPPPDWDEASEQGGDLLAKAEVARETADMAQEEAAGGDVEAQGAARAAEASAEQAERAAEASASAHGQRERRRRARQEQVAEIRAAAFDQAFRQMGIMVAPGDGEGELRVLTADDLLEREESDAAAPDDANGGPAEEPQTEAEGADAEGPPPASGPLGPLRPGTGRLEDRHAEPQPIPQKWRRFDLPLDPVILELGDPARLRGACDAFAAGIDTAVGGILAAWLATEEGQADAYRKGEHILPSQFADADSWNAYLAGLRTRKPAILADIRPSLRGVNLVADLDADFVDPGRANLRIAIQNDAAAPARADRLTVEHAIFQVGISISLPVDAHRPLRLDRVRPSYRFRDWLSYPAMGFNCGVETTPADPGHIGLRTTWMPRYTQPRIDPREVPGVPTSYAALADPATDIADLEALPAAYRRWVEGQEAIDVTEGLPADVAAQERTAHVADIAAYRREADYIGSGIDLLEESQRAYRALEGGSSGPVDREQLERKAAPYRAWLLANETFAQYGRGKFTDWRLFQLAFILAHIPTLASRMPEYADSFDAARDEHAASLLYFPTGGGKSEAFFGLLIFNLFLDRLRGKSRGVTALVRYPLRLLTLQQARRLMRILVRAELVRLDNKIEGWPFEVGFWVGSGNTPNRVAQGFGGVPAVSAKAHADDRLLLSPPDGGDKAAARARRRSQQYREAIEANDKLRICPACGETTGMRRYPGQHGRIGLVCFNETCDWNKAHSGAAHRVPLPFILTDDTIYQRAPSVVLGTIDKLALIGQHDRTINAIAGMFGAARYRDPANGHLFMPRTAAQIEKAEADRWDRLHPAFSHGTTLFHDPFPSLLIQDEGHLLDESLGTFSGLFETMFEQILLRLGSGLLQGQVASWTPAGSSPRPRLAKVIAATATISDPDRQLRVLYQREPFRFPSPGPSLYESFYSAPRVPAHADRRALYDALGDRLAPEVAAPRMRSYVSIMTNGRSHTMTTAGVVSAYHLAFTRLWEQLASGDGQGAITRMQGALPAGEPISGWRSDALGALAGQPDRLATLLDLLRISLTYVTNKKGGDQIIETLNAQVERDQHAHGFDDLAFLSDLISGGVTIAEIQDVMERAEGRVPEGTAFPPLAEVLRNIVATSAISHGVDVDKFNAMFFAGLPSDIAEYIQASSRIGRTHSGFSLLVPTPHSRRDRYVVETHDQFHRFLERMIPPPAVQRWADRAIRRVVPSMLQGYLCGVVEQELFQSKADGEKARYVGFRSAAAVKSWADNHPAGSTGAIRALTDFAIAAVGLQGRGTDAIGAAPHPDHYRSFLEERVRLLLEVFTYRSDTASLANFWSTRSNADVRRPMTSLRDVDAGGVLVASTRDPWRERGVHSETVRHVMKIIRGQRLAVRSDVDADPALIDMEDGR